MPFITSIKIKDLRNLTAVDLAPNPCFNVLYGENAAGKTSFLEAIYVLGTLRSFRTSKLRFLVAEEAEAFSVYAETKDGNGAIGKLGMQKSFRDTTDLKLNGRRVSASSELANSLPLIALAPQSFEFLDGPPQLRRSFLDWLVFHVKPEFLDSWKDYRRCLKQRNMLLRRGKISRLDMKPWDEPLVTAATLVEVCRFEALEKLRRSFASIESADCDYGGDIQLAYRDGWSLFTTGAATPEQAPPTRENLFERLDRNFEADLAQGFTQKGSHRGDILIKSGDYPAAERLSRGQKKRLIISLYMAVTKLLAEEVNKQPVFLLDDLPSELDTKRLDSLCQQLATMDCQVFITTVNAAPLNGIAALTEETCSWFHVKHGSIDLKT